LRSVELAASVGGQAAAPRLPGLDLLRAIAISLVMLFHASLLRLDSAQHWIVRFGWMGVDLFFVLSGFLIAGQLFRPFARGSKPNYPRFFARRLLRTLPAYLVVLAAYFVVPSIRERPNIQPLWQFLTFTENLLIVPPLPKAFSHAWSLCVEEQFYLLLPAAFAIVALRPSASKIIGLIVIVFLGGMVVRGYLWLHRVGSEPFSPTANVNSAAYMTLIYWPTWGRLDGLLAGVTAAAIKVLRPNLWATLMARPNLLIALGLLGVITSGVFFGDYITWFVPAVFGYPFLACSIALIVMAASEDRSIIGRYSIPGAATLAAGAYSLYLSHKAVFQVIATALYDAPAPIQNFGLGIAIIAAFGVGGALYWLVERPFLRLRDRFEGPSRSCLDAAASAAATTG
jgi:peptidoglycan/LPS O-acetylase OafA/YrhL